MNLSVVEYLVAGGKATVATKDASGSIVAVNHTELLSDQDCIVCVPKQGISQIAWAQAPLKEVKSKYPNAHIEKGSLWLNHSAV